MPKIIFTDENGHKSVSKTLDTIEEKLEQIKEYEVEKKLYEAQQEVRKLDNNYNRARSITAGTAFGGVVEINMRADHTNLWCIMQPTEVMELIHQLSGAIGCHINIQPRDDFGSWRGWRTDSENLLPFMSQSHAPHPLIDHSQSIGRQLPIPAKENGEQNEAMAITKTVNKRKSKRTTTPT